MADQPTEPPTRRPRVTRETFTLEQIEAAVLSGQAIVSYSHCLYCGRGTPHETCHAHGVGFEPTPEDMETLETWPGRSQGPETCDLSDEECPYVR